MIVWRNYTLICGYWREWGIDYFTLKTARQARRAYEALGYETTTRQCHYEG